MPAQQPKGVKNVGITLKRRDKAGSKVSVGTPSDVPLKINETDLSKLSASIKPPSGREEPCALKRLPNGNIGITFTPKQVGEHLVSVRKGGNHIANSPFKIVVGSQDVGDATKVKVRGRGIAEADAGQTADFIVDTRNAGYGGLGVSIEGPSKTEINCEDNGDGTCLVTYKPLEPGTYTIHVRYADKEIPGSPFKVQCLTDDEFPMIKETLQKATQAVPVSNVGTNCELGLKIPGTDPLDMTAQVTNPNGKTEDAEIVDASNYRYIVRFLPTMPGVHTISVKARGMHVPGSPFQFTVGPRGEGGTHKVHAGGPGLERGEVGVPSEFTVWTREAGPGKLGITVGGPAKAPINISDNKDGSYQVSYTPVEPGDYNIEIKFNDHNIPDSPWHPYVTPQMAEARRLSVSSLQEAGLKPGVPASFAVQLNGAKGDLKAKAVTPSGTEDECIITPIDDENFAVRFLPKENGIYSIHVFFKNAPIPGSPFKIRVGADVGDPGMVNAYGDGLEKATTGLQAEFTVNTCGAGAGTLAITVDGPSQVKMKVEEVPEGYKCKYTAPLPGAYLINIRYAGQQHIVGSPFRANVTGQAKSSQPAKRHEFSTASIEGVSKTAQPTAQIPQFQSDATKVQITGMGIKKAFVNKKSQFSVNAGLPGCGQNMISVGIAGPKTPCDEVVLKHQGRNRYVVNYTLKERGNYVLIVKWGEQHIQGSPFLISCT